MSLKTQKPGSSKDPEDDTSKVSKPPPEPKINQYPSDDKPKRILDILDRNRATGEFCDVELKLSPFRTVHAHKAILCACSPYFEAMFTSTFMEASSDFVDMSHTTETPEILENVINSFYGHQFEINDENAAEILNLATMLLIEDLRDVCGRVMRKSVGVRNAAEMLQLAFNFQIDDLKELVKPILYCRFHDYIMLQEDLVEMGTESFQYLLKLVNTSHVSRKAEYIKLILNWFNRSEGDDRATVAINALQFNMNFTVTKRIYKEIANDIAEIILHLKEVNSDVSPEMRDKFLIVLEALKPAGYDPDETYESELEEPMGPNINHHRDRIPIGPRTKEQGYTQKELDGWKDHGEAVDEYNKISAKWFALIKKHEKKNPKFSLFSNNDKELIETGRLLSEIKRRHDRVTGEFKTRTLKVKTPAELEEESRLLDMLVVLVPSTEVIQSLGKESEEVIDEMILCAYVTRKKAWYKLGTVNAAGVAGSTEKDTGKSSGSRRHGYPDPEEMEDMMHMYGPDMPEMMMMMEDMPGPHHRHMMEHMSRRRMPPRMMHRMMMDMEEDMPGGRSMRGMGMGGFSERSSTNSTGARSLLKGQWKMVYLKQKLYFCNLDVIHTIWSFDLTEKKWHHHRFSTKGKHRENGLMDKVEYIDIIVMGQTVYVVILITGLDTRNDYWSSRDRGESDSKTVKTRFKILRLTEEDIVEEHYETQPHDSYVLKTQFIESRRDKDDKYSYEPATPLKKGVMKTVLHREDDEKMNIIVMVRTDYRGMLTFEPSHMVIVWLDLKEEDTEIDLPHHYNFVREINPVMNDDVMALITDSIVVTAQVNLAKPDTHRRCNEFGTRDPDSTHFKDSLEHYPKCKSLIANDGRKLWIIEGGDRDISEVTVVTSQMTQDYSHTLVKKQMITPPPFTYASLACPGNIDRILLRRFNPPTKYLHA